MTNTLLVELSDGIVAAVLLDPIRPTIDHDKLDLVLERLQDLGASNNNSPAIDAVFSDVFQDPEHYVSAKIGTITFLQGEYARTATQISVHDLYKIREAIERAGTRSFTAAEVREAHFDFYFDL